MNKSRFYAFQFLDGRETTTGNRNPRNGRMSKAGFQKIFTDIKIRDAWVSAGCDSIDGRIAVTKKELRDLCAGMSKFAFDEMLEAWE